MTSRTLIPLLLLAVALLASAPATAAPRVNCDRSTGVRFERAPGRTAGTLVWVAKPSAKRGSRYRVLRNGKVVGQTTRRKMRVRVRIGGTYTFTVRTVSKRGKVARCGQRLRRKIAYLRPGRPEAVGATSPLNAGTVRLSWERSARGDARLAGYRVFRDGSTVGQTKETGLDVRISSNRSYELRVAAVDTRGKLSPMSDSVTVQTGHEAPPAPTGLIATDVDESGVTLSWTASAPPRGRIVGYRVFRDGKLVRQVQGTSYRLTNLYANTDHSLTVVAVDSLGYLSPASQPLAVTTTRPEQTAGRTHAYLLASTDRSFADLRANYRRIGTVYPTYFDCSTASVPTVTGRDDPLMTTWSLQRGLRVIPRFNCQRNTTLHKILNDPAVREAWLERIVDIVVQNGYTGANLDFESGFPYDRDAYSAFAAELARRLHDRGKLLAIAVSAKAADIPNHPRSTFFDYNALATHADTIFVMAWGIHWTTSAPGAPDDIGWVRNVVKYVQTIPHREKFVLGSPLYGMDWAGDGGSDQPADHYEYEDVIALAARVGATPRHDAATDTMRFEYVDASGVPHQVWFSDASTLRTRIALAREAGLATGFWRLGREDQRLWSDPGL